MTIPWEYVIAYCSFIQYCCFYRYLTEHLTSPSTIPINVQLTVPEKSFVVRDVLLRPDDSMGAILKKLKALMEVKGMKIVEFPACNEFEVSIIRC